MQKLAGMLWLLAAITLLPERGYAQQPIRWEATLENAQRLAGQTNRLVLIHFSAPWCGVCERMEAEVLTQPAVSAELAADYVPVKINADHFPATATQYGVTALPTTVITTPQGKMLGSMRGLVEAPDYTERLRRVAAGFKQSAAATYAQVPTGPAPAAAVRSAPVQSPPITSRPAAIGSSPSAINGPSLVSNAQPPTTGSETAARNPGMSDDRYSDFFRQGQTTPVTPIAQPSSTALAPTAVQPPISYPVPAQANVPPVGPLSQPAITQANRPIPAAIAAPALPAGQAAVSTSGASAYGARAPQPTAEQIASLQSAKPNLALSGNPALQSPTINPALGLDGYCPVTLAEKQQWVIGDRRWGAIHRGRTYLFSGPEQQRRFFADPDRYAPAVAGNDVVLAAEQGQAMPGMREHGVFFGNHVYLFASEATLEKFARNPNVYANQAMGAVRPGANNGQPVQ